MIIERQQNHVRNDLDVFAEMVLEKGGLTDDVIDAMPGTLCVITSTQRTWFN